MSESKKPVLKIFLPFQNKKNQGWQGIFKNSDHFAWALDLRMENREY